MCLLLFAYKVHPAYPLVLAANRDESYQRATAPAAFWSDHPLIYGGRDLEHGGSWLAITRGGRIAAVTNFRDPYAGKNGTRSRGDLVKNFLRGSQSPSEYVNRVSREAGVYNGFNLLAGDLEDLYYFSNRGNRVAAITPGIHGLSNHLLNTPWPKVEHGKRIVAELLRSPTKDLATGLFDILADRSIADDETLPDTGVGLPRERLLSPAFISSSNYGTRASTVVLIDNHGLVQFIERSFGERGKPLQTVTGRFTLETAVASAA
jgi:uncharacterized protein with NRDE domain